jgi:hypothetical protein
MQRMAYLRLLIISLCFNLQGCALTVVTPKGGVALFIVGMAAAYSGYKLAKINLEQWAMKLLKVGAMILLLG